jgi:transposase
MANRLTMAIVQAILQLQALGWSQRRIARQLGIDRSTVRRCLACCLAAAKPAIPPAGSLGSKPATFSGVPGPGAEESGCAAGAAGTQGQNQPFSPAGSQGEADGSTPLISPTGAGALGGGCNPVLSHFGTLPADDNSLVDGTATWTHAIAAGSSGKPGRLSHCEPYRALIQKKLDQQLSAQRIFQDLSGEHGFAGAYDSVKRFVRRLGVVQALPMRRMECAPGQEAQVDFGSGAWIVAPDGKRRKSHVFRIVLSHSRKGYSEATNRQTTEDFIRALENAFAHFGGVPQTLLIDNLRAAVSHPDWFDPELVPKLQSFCQHYGTVILPTKSYTPRHKGKIERGIGYVKGNALKARQFTSLEDESRHLANWEATVADTRIHGTTRRQVGKVFGEVEQAALGPLPRERFSLFHEAQRKVSRDGHVEVAKAYYSVPPEYLGRTVWARWDARLVRIFNHRFEPIALHVRHEQGRFSTHAQHIAREKISGLERGAAYLLGKLDGVGATARQWAEAMLDARGIEGTRVLLGLVSLSKRHSGSALEKACETALSYGAFRLQTLRKLLERQAAGQLPLSFLDEHPIIRPLDDYARVVAAALQRTASRHLPDPQSEERFLRHDRTKECRGSDGSRDGTPPAASTLPTPSTQQRGPGGLNRQGQRDILPPWSGYPLSGCSPAEPDSVSPDHPSVVAAGRIDQLPMHPLHPEDSHHE